MQVEFGAGRQVNAASALEELDVLEAERLRPGATPPSVRVLAWAEKEEESDDDHVGNGLPSLARPAVRRLSDLADDRERDGLDAERGWVLLAPRPP